jgi:nitrogenase molybdenum-iron protein alpha/beta subunit
MTVRRHGHTDLFGIFLASHAVPDSFCLLHAGVGCKTKGQQHLVNQDWIRESFSRTAWSEIGDIEVILGSGARLEAAIKDWIARRSPSVMAVATSAFVELRGENTAETIRRAQAGTGCRLLYLPAKGYDGDLFRGYEAYLAALLRTLEWEGAQPQGDLVNVLGYLFDRYEMEHRANADELGRLLGGIGLKLHRIFLSGTPYSLLRDAPRAGLQVCLPYMRPPPPPPPPPPPTGGGPPSPRISRSACAARSDGSRSSGRRRA